ncbi:MAG: response regulator, partial [Alsobacter sp.]
EAWERLVDTTFDMALIDLDMPRLDGLGLIMRIRSDERLATLPVVVITGRDDLFAIDRAYEVGATSYVTKPLNWRLLSYQLRFVLRADRAARAAAAAARGPAELGDTSTAITDSAA